MGGLAALLAIVNPGKTNNLLAIEGKTKELEGNFVHIVFFWLIDDNPETKNKLFSELKKFIDHVDVIKTKHIGKPADTDREVIDNTYSFNLVLSFESKKEHDIYQEHQLHKDFIENASYLWKKVLVYDSVKV